MYSGRASHACLAPSGPPLPPPTATSPARSPAERLSQPSTGHVLACTERTVKAAVAPPRSKDQRAGVASAETSLHDRPPVPMITMEPLRFLLAAGEDAPGDDAMKPAITRAASTATAVAAASRRRRVTSNRLRAASARDGDVG